MVDIAERRWRCHDCNVISMESALLTAPNPFDATDTLLGCPYCKNASQFAEICDEPGCDQLTSGGFPAGPEYGGYRRTCHKHSDWAVSRARIDAVE